MKNSKVLILALVMFAFFANVVRAEINSGVGYVHSKEEVEQIQEERVYKMEKIKSSQQLRAFDNDFYARVNVTLFVQEKDYYCGPATVKQTMNSVKGWSESQDFYATVIKTTDGGTDYDVLAKYLRYNATNQFPDYTYEKIDSYRYWMESVRYCLDRKRKPVVLDVTGFAPGSTGHFINIDIIEVKGREQRVRVVDPNNDRRYGGYVWYDAYDVYQKNLRHSKSRALW